MADHTPTPWLAAIEDLSQGMVKAAIDGHMIHIATISGSMTNPEIAADAAFIVKAVNAHDELVAALKAVIDATRAYLPPDGIPQDELINRVLAATDNPRINAALAKAEAL